MAKASKSGETTEEMIERVVREPSSGPHRSDLPEGSRGALKLDPAVYMDLLEDDQRTEAETLAVLEALWSIAENFVDRAFDEHQKNAMEHVAQAD